MFFFPLFDDNPTGQRPFICWFLIAACIAVFFWQLGLDARAEQLAAYRFGVTPALFFGLEAWPPGLQKVPGWATVLTSAFLHGGWLHLGGNMLYLWIFGDNVEDAMGPVRFVLFYCLCALGAALAQGLVDPSSTVPMIGASGAIAGVLGAYLVLHPRAAVRVLLVILIFFRFIHLPAWLVLGVWIAGQFIAVPAALNNTGGGGVAYFAHIGGFVTGMVLIPFFKRREVMLFDRGLPKPNEAEGWQADPVDFATLRDEARQRYRRQPLEKGDKSGSVPSFRRRPKGPWDRD